MSRKILSTNSSDWIEIGKKFRNFLEHFLKLKKQWKLDFRYKEPFYEIKIIFSEINQQPVALIPMNLISIAKGLNLSSLQHNDDDDDVDVGYSCYFCCHWMVEVYSCHSRAYDVMWW